MKLWNIIAIIVLVLLVAILVIIKLLPSTDKTNHFRVLNDVTELVFKTELLTDSSHKIKALGHFNGIDQLVYLNEENDSSFIFSLGFYDGTNDSVQFWGDDCLLIDQKTYSVEKASVIVYKYDYDRADSWDEESHIYSNPDIGLIGVYNYPWGLLIFYRNQEIHPEIEKLIIREIIKEQF